MTSTRSGGVPPDQEHATAETSGSPTAPIQPDPTAGPADDDAAIRRVLGADDAALRRVLRADGSVRHVLRRRPGDRSAEQARTLVAAARVEHRRRSDVVRVDGLAAAVADVLDVGRGCGR